MRVAVNIGLIGDRSESVPAHLAIPLALRDAATELRMAVGFEWIQTDTVTGGRIAKFDGIWCVPGSPYRSMDGALHAIRHARESLVPFLGTCAGFQHAVIEFARNVLGWTDAEHAETSPHAARAVISPLECGLLETVGVVRLSPVTRIAAAYACAESAEEYLCRYGLNPEFRASLMQGPLRVAATDVTGDVRAVELDGHPFFVATLFQPERAALKNLPVPLAVAFVRACASRA
jgi:CTP synthase (UTP-ammonia lyase)